MPLTVSRGVSLLVALIIAAGGQVVVASSATANIWRVPAQTSTVDPLLHMEEYEIRIAHAVNRARKAHDLSPVRWFDGCVDRMAERWSSHLVTIGELVHRNLKRMLRRCDLQWAGEALVSGTALRPGAAVRAWMHSPPHRAVIMKPRAARAGIGTKLDADGRLVTVLNFGDPA